MNIQKNGINLLLVAEAGLLIIVLVLGLISGAAGVITNPDGDSNNNIVDNGGNNDWNNSEDEQEPGDSQKPGGDEGDNQNPNMWHVYAVPEEYTETRVTFSDAVEAKLATMTVQQKVAQLFVISPEALTGYNTVTAFGNASKQAYDRYPVGGLVYSPKNFQNKAQVQVLLQGTKDYGAQKYGVPAFTVIEEEGGANNSPLATMLGMNRVSSASELGNQGVAAVEQAAKVRGEYVANCGFNLLLSTIADVSPALDTAYRLRTFGTNGELVASLVAADIKAIEGMKVNSALKYFPGKANASANANGILYCDMSIEDLSKDILASYAAGIEAGTSVVTIGNVIVPAITDDENVPCVLSGRTIGLLRESMGFDGIIMTESFSDSAFVNIYGSDSACVEAIKAGVDMIYMPANFEEAYNAVLEAVNNGNISADRLNNAVGRILTEKGI